MDALFSSRLFEHRSHDRSGQPKVRNCGVAHTADMNHANVIRFDLNIPADEPEPSKAKLDHPEICKRAAPWIYIHGTAMHPRHAR